MFVGGRQEYLATREADKLAALEDDIRDEELLFAGGWHSRGSLARARPLACLTLLRVCERLPHTTLTSHSHQHTVKEHLLTERERADIAYKRRVLTHPPLTHKQHTLHTRAHTGKEHLLTERERADIAYKRRVLELAKERKRQLESLDEDRYQMPASYGGCWVCENLGLKKQAPAGDS